MAIIVEGMDNAGKSTLARSFGLRVVHPGPRPETQGEEAMCLDYQLETCGLNRVMDRVTSISTPCYTGNFASLYTEYLDAMLSQPHCVLVYCRPPMDIIKDFSHHSAKSYDDEAKIKWLQDNAEIIVARYDLYMSRFPHLKYDYTNPDQTLLGLAKKAQTNLEAWNRWRSLTTQ